MIHKRYAVRDANDSTHRNLYTCWTARKAKWWADQLIILEIHAYVVKGKIK